ncbi:carboxylesterase family protein [Paenibacillus tyrfis]|uniref:carboxylesterase family protein n=1 Tax=Paenibacillus tyrfis TaxID=1501230 RepID=UPI0015C64C59|nr:carboxylesterase family protein [Paenibacillus tyrfis]
MEIVVELKQGKLKGKLERDVLSFTKIPYGKDMGRFKALAPPEQWEGIYDATVPAPVFPQTLSRLSTVIGTLPEENHHSESAFYLNVYAKNSTRKKPVLFWIHGGAFITGGGTLPWYDGTSIAGNGDLVVVSVNYRLGVLGNLHIPGVSEPNLAFKDLIQAFTWVKGNIAAFGGDPEQMTIAGQSAGAWFATAFMSVPKLQGQFKNAAILSFPGGLRPLKEAEEQVLRAEFLKELSLDRNSWNQLYDLPVETILEAQQKTAAKLAAEGSIASFTPVYDGELLREDIIQGAADVSKDRVHVFIGFTADETTSFFHSLPESVPEEALHKVIGKLTAADARQIVEAYRKTYPNDHNQRLLVNISSELIFDLPTIALMDRLADRGANIYAYRFDYPSSNPKLAACHCLELPFLFGNFGSWKSAPMLLGCSDAENRLVSGQFQKMVIELAHQGERFDLWPKYESRSRKAMSVRVNSEMIELG